jgi:CheY-like chemotaxis protein
MIVKPLTVCIVEPNKFEGQIIIDLLRNAGVEKIKLVADQDAALDLLEVYNANVVIASFEMAPMNGAAWAKVYRRNKKLPGRKQAIFITSGAFSLAMAEECRHAGANALIGKPISAKVLMATINKVLGKPREFIDAEGYVGPCRRAGIVTAGAPRSRRKVDDGGGQKAPVMTLEKAVEAVAVAGAAFAADARKVDDCEASLRFVQAYAVNAGDGPLMRACAAFSLHINATRTNRSDAARAALQACVNGVVQLAAIKVSEAQAREAIAEGVRQAVAKSALQRAA